VDSNLTFAPGRATPETWRLMKASAGPEHHVFVDMHADRALDGVLLINGNPKQSRKIWPLLGAP